MKHITTITKGLALAVSLLVLSLALASCGSSSSAPQSAASTAANAAQSTAAEEPAAPAQGAVAQDGALLYKGVSICPGESAAPVLEALGEPDDYRENISCMFESGMDKTYTYADLTLYTYPTADDERILLAEATGDGAETARGVKVGDALDAALLQYAEDLAPDGPDRYICTFEDVLFSLTAEDGVVSNISVELAETPNS